MSMTVCNQCNRLRMDDAPCPRCVAFEATRVAALNAAARIVAAKEADAAKATVDEAAIRADERAKVEAEVLAWIDVQMRHVRTVPGASFVWRSGGAEALGELADDIRAGKHRRTP